MVKQISASVGLNGTNVPQDVKIVQELLNKVPPAKGGAVPALKVDGLAWTKTTNAIKKFQQQCLNFKWPDGRIDPHGKTFQALSAFDFDPGSRRVVHHMRLRVDRSSLSRAQDQQDPLPGFDGTMFSGDTEPDGFFLRRSTAAPSAPPP
jgi:hypothetical protein